MINDPLTYIRFTAKTKLSAHALHVEAFDRIKGVRVDHRRENKRRERASKRRTKVTDKSPQARRRTGAAWTS